MLRLPLSFYAAGNAASLLSKRARNAVFAQAPKRLTYAIGLGLASMRSTSAPDGRLRSRCFVRQAPRERGQSAQTGLDERCGGAAARVARQSRLGFCALCTRAEVGGDADMACTAAARHRPRRSTFPPPLFP